MEKDKEYYENLDKRTSEYKEYKKKQEAKAKGLGDTVKKVTKATGIDKAVKFVAGEDCGCDERQEKLNEFFTYDVPECLTEDEFEYLQKFFKNEPIVINIDTQKQLLNIHNRIFKNKEQISSCSSCVKRMIGKLRKVMKGYK